MALIKAWKSDSRKMQHEGDKIIFRADGLKRPVTLSKHGVLTSSGNRLVEQGWRPPQENVVTGTPTFMRGKREMTTLSSGREVMVRQWKH